MADAVIQVPPALTFVTGEESTVEAAGSSKIGPINPKNFGNGNTVRMGGRDLVATGGAELEYGGVIQTIDENASDADGVVFTADTTGLGIGEYEFIFGEGAEPFRLSDCIALWNGNPGRAKETASGLILINDVSGNRNALQSSNTNIGTGTSEFVDGPANRLYGDNPMAIEIRPDTGVGNEYIGFEWTQGGLANSLQIDEAYDWTIHCRLYWDTYSGDNAAHEKTLLTGAKDLNLCWDLVMVHATGNVTFRVFTSSSRGSWEDYTTTLNLTYQAQNEFHVMWDAVEKKIFIGVNGDQESFALNQTAWVNGVDCDEVFYACGSGKSDAVIDAYWQETYVIRARCFPTGSTYTAPTARLRPGAFHMLAYSPYQMPFGNSVGSISDCQWVNDTIATYDWDGSAWATGASAVATRTNDGGGPRFGAAGTPSDAYYFGAQGTATEEYNGTAFSTGATMSTSRDSPGGSGHTTSNAIVAGGSGAISSTEEYNGVSWSSGGALPAADATIIIGGDANAAIAIADNFGATYNGTSWTTTSNTPATTLSIIGGFGDNVDGFMATGFGTDRRDCYYYAETANTWVLHSTQPLSVGQSTGVGGGFGRNGFIPAGCEWKGLAVDRVPVSWAYDEEFQDDTRNLQQGWLQ